MNKYLSFTLTAVILTTILTNAFIRTAQASTIVRANPDTLFDAASAGFSQVVIAPKNSRTVYLSGQAALDKDFNVIGDTLQAQISYAMNNLKLAIDAAGAKPENVLRIKVLMVDHQEADVYFLAEQLNSLFANNLPASTLIPVPRLALPGMKFEIEVTLAILD